jgi:hypothetical protein
VIEQSISYGLYGISFMKVTADQPGFSMPGTQDIYPSGEKAAWVIETAAGSGIRVGGIDGVRSIMFYFWAILYTTFCSIQQHSGNVLGPGLAA